jgi:AraC family transcriptional regulator
VQIRRKLAPCAADNGLDLVEADRTQVRRGPYLRGGEAGGLHLYVPTVAFARLMDDYNLPAVPARSIRYSCAAQDEVINQIGLSVLSEMMSPTAAGRMLVETSSLLLAARLAHSHLETELIRSPIQSRHRLDDARLRRVLVYVEEHLAEDITVADLANVACLSIFHFTRAFAAAMGVPPVLAQKSFAGN